jgi:thiol-disulfide isomerase/thioredoxin
MPRLALLFFLSLTATAASGLVLETARRAQAQSRVPLDTPAGTASPAPAWRNVSWLNTDHALSLSELKGRVVLLNFWVFTCYNCTNTVPSLVDFDRKYRDRGLTLIGIHTPEFPPYAGEHDRANVERALRKYGVMGRGGATVPSVILSAAKDRVGDASELRASLACRGVSCAPLWMTTAALRMTLVALGLATACSRPPAEFGLLQVTTAPSGPDTRLTLHAGPHLKINARLAPALELGDGTVLRFYAGLLTADSAYYAEPPSAVLVGRQARVHGTLRASVCRDDEQVCRAVRIEI